MSFVSFCNLSSCLTTLRYIGLGVSDVGVMASDVLVARQEREGASLQSFQVGISVSCLNLKSLHHFLYTSHSAYSAGKAFNAPSDSNVKEAVLKSY